MQCLNGACDTIEGLCRKHDPLHVMVLRHQAAMTIWLPQKPDCPENGYPTCPDCNGIDDLRRVIGRFGDTRIMRK